MAWFLNASAALLSFTFPLMAMGTETHPQFEKRSYAANKSEFFSFEKIQLTDSLLSGVGDAGRQYFGFGNISAPGSVKARTCKVFPGDQDWPNDSVWTLFNHTLGGTLLKPLPAASVCYNNTGFSNFSPSECQKVSANWTNAYSQ